MKNVTKGTWIVNSYKHLLAIRQDAAELAYFEATDMAGKSAALLARLVADSTEVVPANKVKVFAGQSGIRRAEIKECLRLLKEQDKIDYLENTDGAVPDVEVYSFSVQDALATGSSVYDRLGPTEYEQASLLSLQETFELPQANDELIEDLTAMGITEATAISTLKLQESLGLVKVARSPQLGHPVFYNEHAFAGDPTRIVAALRGLNDNERQNVEDIQHLVDENAGFPLDDLHKKFPARILDLMEGVGLLDGTKVDSPVEEAVFITSPQLKGIAIGTPALSADVFHKAKVLLCCLRFGQMKSYMWRGKLESFDKMLNTINKLLRGEWIGPCTAIGQDYKVLEIDGVVETRTAIAGYSGQYEMRLRQMEVGRLVKQMLVHGRVIQEDSIGSAGIIVAESPVSYEYPELRRREIIAKQTKPVEEIRDRLLQSIRTGVRGTRV